MTEAGGKKLTRETPVDHSSLFNLRTMMRVEKDLNTLLDFIVNESSRIVDADRATLFLYEEETGQLWSKIALGTTEIIRFNADQGIAGEVFQTGRIINVEDAYKYEGFNPAIDKMTGHVTRSLLCVPLKNIDGKSIGVLQALNKKGGVFTAEDEEILGIFAGSAAVAIENAKFIDELEGTQSRLKEENSVLIQKSEGRFFVNNIIGTSPKINEVVKIIEKIADSPLDVLVKGESGTGKELASRMIHYNSERADKPFVDINCAALPESILESELFGIEKGVATGVDRREGKIEQADGGTLFLDEIADMSLAAQAKLLRALQERKISRLGSKSSIDVDIRIVAATNKDLTVEIGEGNFREDLYYRLNVVHIKMPPLREIRDDIPLLAKHFLADMAQKTGKADMRFSSAVLECFQNYSWPGNVRELENEVKRAAIMADGDVIEPSDISEHIRSSLDCMTAGTGNNEGEGTLSMKETVERIEISMIKDALEKTGGNKEKASSLLGITRQGLFKKMKRYGL
jgi:Nif-specific regulatory protein